MNHFFSHQENQYDRFIEAKSMQDDQKDRTLSPSQDILTQPDFFEELFTLAPTPNAVFSKDGQCLLTNRAFQYQLAFELEEAVENPNFRDFLERPAGADPFLTLLSERQVIRRHELRLKDSEGRVFSALVSGRTLAYQGTEAFEISFTDISKQKKLQIALRREHARLYSLVENLTAGLFLVNNDGNITAINMWLADLLGLDQQRLIGEPVETIFTRLVSQAVEPEVVQQALERAMVAAHEKPSVSLSLQQEKPLHLDLTLFPVWDEDGLPLAWGGLVQDVTVLRDQVSWKLELLSILAHDIRTPLATLKGHATALLANYPQWSRGMVTEFLEAINRGVDDLVHQVDQSLALTRVETGRLGLRPEAINPKRIIEQSLERSAGILEAVSIDLDVPDKIPAVRVDPARVEEVLINLLENAARYSSPGEPIVIQVIPAGNMVQISVTDQGPGIPEEKQGSIFEKHVRLDRGGGGTGLGLFISRRIVEAHGGQLWVESQPDAPERGSTFHFTLPVMPSVDQDRPADVPAVERRPDPAEDSLRVLVVEDEPDMQALLRKILKDAGYQVEIAPTGPTALDIIQASPPAVVLLDWVLPGMSGLSVCRNIRRWSDVPIMMVTSLTSQEELVAALDAGADDYVLKPFVSTEILARIRALLRRGETWSAAHEPDRFSADGLVIDFETRQAWVRGEELELTPKEYDLMAYMAHHPRQVLTYQQLISNVWDSHDEITRHGLFVHVSRLRRKIEADPENPRFIVTRWGTGYIFMPGQKDHTGELSAI